MLSKGNSSVKCRSLISEAIVRKKHFSRCSPSLLSPGSAGSWPNTGCVWDGIKGQKNKTLQFKAAQLCTVLGWRNGWLSATPSTSLEKLPFPLPSECSAHCDLSKDAYASTDAFGNRVTLAGLCQGFVESVLGKQTQGKNIPYPCLALGSVMTSRSLQRSDCVKRMAKFTTGL